jgi:glutamate-ammonia-ligase adenylyltransferase
MLSRLPAGVQLFSLFLANPQLLDLVATIAGSTPRLADTMARAPATLDALLDRDFLAMLPLRGELDRSLRQAFQMERGFEGALDAARRFAREQIFRVGVQLIEGRAQSAVVGTAFANIAESIIAGLLDAVQDELALTAGRVKDGAFVVIAMGKLGGREMTASSDLDLIFVYDAPADTEFSDGPKPLAVSTYYARLAQRFISALTVPTGEGVLYEVDMRLRPSGNKGPVAVSFETFTRYQASEAWTWERLALTRARVVAGEAGLSNTVMDAIRTALSTPSPRGDLIVDARAMRDKLAAQFPGKNRWDLKFAPGGLVDIEFIAQALQLQCASRDVLRANTIEALETLAKAGALDAAEAKTLIDSARLQQALTQTLRIAIDGTLDPDTASPGLKSLLIHAGNAGSFALLEGELIRAQAAVRNVFERVLPSVS